MDGWKKKPETAVLFLVASERRLSGGVQGVSAFIALRMVPLGLHPLVRDALSGILSGNFPGTWHALRGLGFRVFFAAVWRNQSSAAFSPRLLSRFGGSLGDQTFGRLEFGLFRSFAFVDAWQLDAVVSG